MAAQGSDAAGVAASSKLDVGRGGRVSSAANAAGSGTGCRDNELPISHSVPTKS